MPSIYQQKEQFCSFNSDSSILSSFSDLDSSSLWTSSAALDLIDDFSLNSLSSPSDCAFSDDQLDNLPQLPPSSLPTCPPSSDDSLFQMEMPSESTPETSSSMPPGLCPQNLPDFSVTQPANVSPDPDTEQSRYEFYNGRT